MSDDAEIVARLRASAADAAARGITRVVVGAVVCDAGRVLLLRRRGDDFMGGLLELPSGEVSEGEDVVDALRRELLEETGLEIDHFVAELPSFDYFSRSGQRTRQLNVSVTPRVAERVTLTEHDDFLWLPLAEHRGVGVSDEVRRILDAGAAVLGRGRH